ncbi:MAG: site-specific integrase [Desulfohalobiaceae bacterium]|nr:site-specific integrase [Desulfohalobiaceae bacterium]
MAINQEEARRIMKECSRELTAEDELSDKSLAKYEKQVERLGDNTPREYCEAKGTTRGTYYMYRAAALHHYSDKLREAINEVGKARRAKDQEWASKAREEMKETALHLQAIHDEQYEQTVRPPSRQRLQQLQAHHGDERGLEIASRRQKRHGKRKSLAGLPEDWMIKVQRVVPEKYQQATAVLQATGLRPSEIERGVLVMGEEDQVVVKIWGSKYDHKDKGHEYRILAFDRESAAGQLLDQHTLVGHPDENPVRVSTPENVSLDAFTKAYKRACEKALGFRGRKMSVYSARHQVGSNLKAEGWDHDDIARAMGHQSTESQAHYGSNKQGKGGSGLVAVDASGPVRTPEKNIESGPRPGL